MSKVLSGIFALTLILGSGPQRVNALEGNALDDNAKIKQIALSNLKSRYSQNLKFSGVKTPENIAFNDNASSKSENPDEKVRVIVQLKDKAASELTEKGNVASAKAVESVKASQASIKAKAKKLTGGEVRHTYGNLINGFSMDVKRSEIEKIKQLPGVQKVTEARLYYPQMKSAKELTEAYKVWEDLGYKGEGMVVSIIDTGIDYTHKDMKNPKESSKIKLKDKNPEGLGKYYTDKVPYGYNYADRNDEVIDTTDSMHGMHVAGIVAAAGDEKEVNNLEAVQGVAPEAQLLAMKVFSNNPALKGAYADDIVAAIEDSVSHGADVINMSLGSTASFQQADDPEQKAIKNAVDAGVVVVVSAGNSQYSTAPFKFGEIADTGLVGAPGLAKDSLQVANFENNNVTLPALEYKAGDKSGLFGYTTSEVNPVRTFKADQSFELVDCGLGESKDFTGKSLTGKIALIKRGGNTFIEKKVNAQNAGATGVIVYNKDGDDSYINMATDPAVKIPGVFVTNSDGKILLSLVQSGLKISFGEKVVVKPNINKDDFSGTTSWGPTPNLDFKPQIAAPGGNIYSTVNSDKYETMSGTSMAAPHVAGGQALLLQAIKNNLPALKGRELVDFAKNTAINTAKVVMDKAHTTVPYSPRRQGAGLMQIKSAINNKVLALGSNGEAVVALKQIGKDTEFEIILKNYGDKEAVYDVENFGGVLTEQNKEAINSMSYDVALTTEEARVSFDKEKITVPAKGEVKIKVSLNITDKVTTERFIEGFIKFKAQDSIPSLVVPFMGYYGDWSKEKIINDAIWDFKANNNLPASMVLSKNDKGEEIYLGYDGEDKEGNNIIDKDSIAISPNGDKVGDFIVPHLYYLRNAKYSIAQLLDKDKNLITELGREDNIKKKVYNDTNNEGDKPYTLSALAWDGKIFNSKTGEYEALPEGQYYINIKSAVDYEGAKEQDFIIPVKIDLSAPEVTIVSPIYSYSDKYLLKWRAKDSSSSISKEDPVVMVNGEEQKVDIKFEDGFYSCEITLEKDKYNDVKVAMFDKAYNLGIGDVAIRYGKDIEAKVVFDNLDGKLLEISKEVYTVTGRLTAPLKTFKINNEKVKINNNLTFSYDIKLKEGLNYIPVYAEDSKGTILMNYSYKINCDTIAPVIDIEQPVIDKDNVANLKDNKLILKGKVSDNTYGYKFFLNGENKFNVSLEGEMGSDKTQRSFQYELNVEDGSFIELKAVDVFGNETVKKIKIKIEK